ncbi:hypothetical protein EDC96DRAFT_545388 [Choanephora cucurbitarum]|nr:hypothetical protein EDC96DRAFT_545388 [Choanephora cucurbitarum]
MYLHYLDDDAFLRTDEKHLSLDYYSLVSAIYNRLSFIKPDITSELDLPLESNCFLYPSRIKRHTHFNSVKRLVCISDALTLCPSVTEVSIEWCDIKEHEHRLMHATMKKFNARLFELTDANLDYIISASFHLVHASFLTNALRESFCVHLIQSGIEARY